MAELSHASRRKALTIAVATAVVFQVSIAGAPPLEVLTTDLVAQTLTDRLLEDMHPRTTPPLTTDFEHARTMDPVLNKGTAVWIHENLPSAPLTVVGGRVFQYRDTLFNPLDAPVLKIRPIDGDQVIPFLVRIVIRSDQIEYQSKEIDLDFPIPGIFDPRIEKVSAWIEGQPAATTITRSPGKARIGIRIALEEDILRPDARSDASSTILVEGELVLQKYRRLPAARFRDFGDSKRNHELNDLRKERTNRQINGIADELVSDSSTDYQKVESVIGWVGSHMRYQENSAHRSAIEILEDRFGDCEDYTELSVALLRASGIPSRQASGVYDDFNRRSAHSWVEIALPTRNGDLQWFLCDPTMAGSAHPGEEVSRFVQYVGGNLHYPIRPKVGGAGSAVRHTTDIFLNWRLAKQRIEPDPLELIKLIDRVILNVDREIAADAERLASEDLTLRRESASVIGSPYLIVDRPLSDSVSGRLQLRLENEERFVLDLVSEDGKPLDSADDRHAIDRFRSAYRSLNHRFFEGQPAKANLELTYHRDRHEDSLQMVRLSFGRYLIEKHLDRILEELQKKDLLTPQETAFVAQLSEACDQKNFYLLQEMAREIPG